MSKRTPLNVRYRHALPVHPIELPNVVPHNPLSWLYCLYVFWTSTVSISRTTVTCDENGHFFVNDPQHMNVLWSEGFFGKGVFSRSDPTWNDRTQKRLGIGEFKNLTMEEITAIRREERKKFKKERANLESKQAELKKKGIVDPFLEERLKLKELRDKDISVKLERETYIREEDSEILDDNGHLINIETLQLQPSEVFFLHFALQATDVYQNSIKLSTSDLLSTLWPSRLADDKFILNYIVYHHYRSLGWCVRSGIKFGTDWLLYKRGPPFHHAEFTLLILPNYKDDVKNSNIAKDYVWLSSLNRVVSSVRKNLVLVFLDVPDQSAIDDAKSVSEILNLYKIHEVLYRRWIPNKNRD